MVLSTIANHKSSTVCIVRKKYRINVKHANNYFKNTK
jgi:hypothetical protein